MKTATPTTARGPRSSLSPSCSPPDGRRRGRWGDESHGGSLSGAVLPATSPCAAERGCAMPPCWPSRPDGSLNGEPGVDGKVDAGHEPSLVRGQPCDGVADVVRLDGADREQVHERTGGLRPVPEELGQRVV